MNCKTCGGVLPLDSAYCAYCDTPHPVDINTLGEYRLIGKQSDMKCPQGHGALNLLRVDAAGGVTVASCPLCFGLFMSRNTLSTLLKHISRQVINTKLSRLTAIEQFMTPKQTAILATCPSCAIPLEIRQYSATCPVKLAVCAQHGIWLDNGKLTFLAEWLESGGANVAFIGEAGQQKALSKLDQHQPGIPPYLLRFWPASRAAKCLRILEMIVIAIFLWYLPKMLALFLLI